MDGSPGEVELQAGGGVGGGYASGAGGPGGDADEGTELAGGDGVLAEEREIAAAGVAEREDVLAGVVAGERGGGGVAGKGAGGKRGQGAGGGASGTSGIASYSVTAGGVLTAVQGLATSGNGPFDLLLDSTGTYLYAANKADSTLSGYTASAGSLTALATSPFASNTSTTALARDNSGKYILALGNSGSGDLTLFGQDAITPGKLGALVSVSTGSAGATRIAATHTSAGL